MSAKDQIKQLVDYFKRERYLKDKTDAMGDGLMLGASLADEANERSKEATTTTKAIQEKYKEQILAQDLNPNKDPELVDLRNGNATAGERITKFEQETTAQFQQTEDIVTASKNADFPISIPTYDGSGQSTHPSVVFIKNGFNGYYYWMGFTPYPSSNDDYENPSIIASNDGINWVVPNGLANPVDKPTPEETLEGKHMSDTHLIFDGSKLQLFYRFSRTDVAYDWIYRKTSSDGVNWTGRELVYESKTNGDYILSPAIILESGVYKMWFINMEGEIFLTQSKNIPLWSEREEINISYSEGLTYKPWHMDMMKDGEDYVITINAFRGVDDTRDLVFGISSDGKNFNNVDVLLKPSAKGWDSGFLYRASLVKVEEEYQLYYAAFNKTGASWGMGLLAGSTINSMQNVPLTRVKEKEIENLITNLIRSGNANGIISLLDKIQIISGAEKEPTLKLIKNGVKGASFGLSKIRSDTFEVLADNPLNKGNLELEYLFANYIMGLNGRVGFLSNVSINADAGKRPLFELIENGVRGIRLTMIERNDTLKISGSSGVNPADIEVGNIILGSSFVGDKEGALRYNSVLKKHEGFNGTSWTALY